MKCLSHKLALDTVKWRIDRRQYFCLLHHLSGDHSDYGIGCDIFLQNPSSRIRHCFSLNWKEIPVEKLEKSWITLDWTSKWTHSTSAIYNSEPKYWKCKRSWKNELSCLVGLLNFPSACKLSYKTILVKLFFPGFKREVSESYAHKNMKTKTHSCKLLSTFNKSWRKP